jgi:hypothetical protein
LNGIAFRPYFVPVSAHAPEKDQFWATFQNLEELPAEGLKCVGHPWREETKSDAQPTRRLLMLSVQ